eukprot:8004312-Alexandrium_andersonii.AAC.1
MSASLVGSEMCIRDRKRGASRAPVPAKRPGGGARGPHRLAPPTGRKPVSYTHLTLPTICSV